MEITALIEALSDPAAYSHPVGEVEVHQTHISAVFLAGPYAYKLKKPVNLGFLDFTTLEKRRYYCEQEVRLNRRLAPGVYRGVVPVTCSGTRVFLEGPGEVLDWAVKMERLPERAILGRQLERGEVPSGTFENLGQKIAAFHGGAQTGPHIAPFGRFPVVAGNARENFTQSAPLVGTTITRPVFDRLQVLTEEALVHLQGLIEFRAEHGFIRDTHGDLHLEHVYLFPEKPPLDNLVIIDCIEFNERFRFADPVADMAFLVMDLLFVGRKDLAEVFAQAYFQASGDEEGKALLPFYTAYRAAVRGKVEGMELAEREIPEAERAAALGRARAHWLLALGVLEEPGRRPCLVLVGGLPGTGKSTLARILAEQAQFQVIRSDAVRKELAGRYQKDPATAPFQEGLYTPPWTERTYAECWRRVEKALFDGERVLVDASFMEEKRRRSFLESAARLGVPAVFFLCRAGAEIVRSRLDKRHSDASDADWCIYQKAAQRWEEMNSWTRQGSQVINTGAAPEQALAQALVWLRQGGLAC